MHADDLKAIAPDGSVRWSVPLFGIEAVDVDASGNVYTGSMRTVHKFRSDGTLLWSFTEPAGGQGIMAGPTVGPDGNVYGVTDQGGLGAFSLTPAGKLRWNIPGFWDREGRGESPVAMGADRFYFAETSSTLPECPPATGMLAAISFDGDLLWCVGLTNPSRPVVAPNGNVYVSHAGSEIRAYTPDGALDWFFDLPRVNSTIVGPSAGPGSEAYAFQVLDYLWALGADGALAWETQVPQGNALHAPTASPDGETLLFGAYAGSPQFMGTLVALDAATGIERWATSLEVVNRRVTGRAAFSQEGSVAYVPVSTLADSELLAIHVGAGPAPLSLTVTGSCPGPVTVDIANAPANSEVAVIAAGATGGWTKGGAICNGTVLEIAEPFQLPPTWVRIDSTGRGSGSLSLAPGRCWLEALAVADCSTSGAVPVE